MRSISILAFSLCTVALVGVAARAEAQAAPAKPSAPQGTTHLVLPPVPKPLLPGSFAGWTAATPPMPTRKPPASPEHPLQPASPVAQFPYPSAAPNSLYN